jgi:hypothetical protein
MVVPGRAPLDLNARRNTPPSSTYARNGDPCEPVRASTAWENAVHPPLKFWSAYEAQVNEARARPVATMDELIQSAACDAREALLLRRQRINTVTARRAPWQTDTMVSANGNGNTNGEDNESKQPAVTHTGSRLRTFEELRRRMGWD